MVSVSLDARPDSLGYGKCNLKNCCVNNASCNIENSLK